MERILRNLSQLDLMNEEVLEDAVEAGSQEECQLQDILAHRNDLKVEKSRYL